MATKKIPIKLKEVIKEYVHSLMTDDLPIQKVILFGSHAKNTQQKDSDIDLCIVSEKFKDPLSTIEYLWSKREISDLQYTIEPIGFTPKDMKNKYSTLIHEIKSTGIELTI